MALLRSTGIVLSAVAVIVVAALVAGMFVPRPLRAPQADGTADGREILLLGDVIHTDIALPADPDVLERFAFLAHDGLPLDEPGLRWILAGWGSRSFYIETPTWADLRAGPTLRAFTLDSSALHLELAGEIDPSAGNVQRIRLDEDAFQRVLDGVLSTLDTDGQGDARLIESAAYGYFDQFYEAEGAFNAVFAGCNQWAGEILREGGLRTGWWMPLPSNLLRAVRFHNDLPEG